MRKATKSKSWAQETDVIGRALLGFVRFEIRLVEGSTGVRHAMLEMSQIYFSIHVA